MAIHESCFGSNLVRALRFSNVPIFLGFAFNFIGEKTISKLLNWVKHATWHFSLSGRILEAFWDWPKRFSKQVIEGFAITVASYWHLAPW